MTAHLLISLLLCSPPRPIWVPPDLSRTCAPHFCISYPRKLAPLARTVLRLAPDVRDRMRALLGDDLPDAEVILSSSRKHFRSLLPNAKRVPRWAAAVAYPRLGLIVMGPRLLVASRSEITGLLAHEYSHLALAHATKFHALPTWFVEGVADLQARRTSLSGPFSFEPSLPLSQLHHRFPSRDDRAGFAYDQSRDFVAFLLAMGSSRDFRKLVRLVARGVPFERAVQRVYGRPLKSLRESWRSNWRYRKVIVPLFTSGALLWILAAFLLVAGHRRRRRQLREFETMPDERDDAIEELERDEEEERGPAVHMEIPPGTFLLAAGGLALLLAALLETVWPRVRWTTLLLVAGIVVSLGLIGMWKMSRDAAQQDTEPTEETDGEDLPSEEQTPTGDQDPASPSKEDLISNQGKPPCVR